MDIIPKFVAIIFLFRTLKGPINQIIEIINKSPSPLLVLSFFLLGELGITGLLKLLPLFIYIHSQYHYLSPSLLKNYSFSDIKQYFDQLKNIDKFATILTPVISPIAFVTGWAVRDHHAINSLPINTFLSNLLAHPMLSIIIFALIYYSLRFTNKIILISQLIYLSLFLSADHLSFLFLFVFILIGLLTKRDKPDVPFLSFYSIEACLTIGTLFTTSPINILFAIGSITVVWKLAKLNDHLNKTRPLPDTIPYKDRLWVPKVDTTGSIQGDTSKIINGLH
jgi:hypothetical protein